eukprot:CAMPEP_0185782766 /NCGR_PEP_ID=MMETSP1174-20130828/111562_1 /TAXON_ID=35687 /ORGANISM="Dictyocha speculum, Strain CCMP1381" /LENGTH=182 /DNA_ID=CAMNT_0028473431 /DNA_START=141 /DNA_END=689 /DNA_ORIENTATION=+
MSLALRSERATVGVATVWSFLRATAELIPRLPMCFTKESHRVNFGLERIGGSDSECPRKLWVRGIAGEASSVLELLLRVRDIIRWGISGEAVAVELLLLERTRRAGSRLGETLRLWGVNGDSPSQINALPLHVRFFGLGEVKLKSNGSDPPEDAQLLRSIERSASRVGSGEHSFLSSPSISW